MKMLKKKMYVENLIIFGVQILRHQLPYNVFFSSFNLVLLVADLCEKGYWSIDGFDSLENQQCMLCSKGTYQDQLGGTECKQCQSGYTTTSPGSTSKDDCGSKMPCYYNNNSNIVCNAVLDFIMHG